MNEVTPKSIEQGKRISEVRKNRNFKQEELSDLCNISISYISRIEKGKVNLTKKALNLIAEALQCPVEYIKDGVKPNVNGGGEATPGELLRRKRVNIGVDEISRSVESILSVSDVDMLKCFKDILDWINDYACARKAMEAMPSSEVAHYYDNCLRYINNIQDSLEYNIAHFQREDDY